MARSTKGIFCLEVGDWFGNLRNKLSVEPLLEFLHLSAGAPYIHRNVMTQSELFLYLRKWVQTQHSRYPILYLAFHGEPGAIYVTRESGRKTLLDVADMLDILRGKCRRRIIHFGACGVVGIHGHTMNRYLRETGALAISGYSDPDIDWVHSSVLDLLLFDALQENALTKAGAAAVRRRVQNQSPRICKTLKFRMVIKH
jgi:hypothetical protein